jgi:hypothetical protein
VTTNLGAALVAAADNRLFARAQVLRREALAAEAVVLGGRDTSALHTLRFAAADVLGVPVVMIHEAELRRRLVSLRRKAEAEKT